MLSNSKVIQWVIVLQLVDLINGAFLGQSCLHSSDCKTSNTECDSAHKECICKPYTVQANHTTCLPGVLLGFECELDAQCNAKVPQSGCINGKCSCSNGYIGYRRHTCLNPAKLGDVCFDNQQCNLADRGSYCKFVVPKVFGRCSCEGGYKLSNGRCNMANLRIGQSCQDDSSCQISNAYCQKKLDGHSVCTCDIAFSPSADRQRCIPTYRGLLSPASLGMPCYANLQCQLSDQNSICSGGFCDCVTNNYTRLGCSARNTGCHPQTFQCHSDGRCISWYFMCDGKQDCDDGSDERCEGLEVCPKHTFQCGSNPQRNIGKNNLYFSSVSGSTLSNASQNIYYPPPGNKLESGVGDQGNDQEVDEGSRIVTCISKAKICDGVADCDDKSDENFCSPKNGKCPQGTFKCTTSNGLSCLGEQNFCNSIADCKDLSDENEQKCRMEFQPADYCPFRCKNGLCRSSAILCSGVDGCGDNSDEIECSICRCPRVQSSYSSLASTLLQQGIS